MLFSSRFQAMSQYRNSNFVPASVQTGASDGTAAVPAVSTSDDVSDDASDDAVEAALAEPDKPITIISQAAIPATTTTQVAPTKPAALTVPAAAPGAPLAPAAPTIAAAAPAAFIAPAAPITPAAAPAAALPRPPTVSTKPDTSWTDEERQLLLTLRGERKMAYVDIARDYIPRHTVAAIQAQWSRLGIEGRRGPNNQLLPKQPRRR